MTVAPTSICAYMRCERVYRQGGKRSLGGRERSARPVSRSGFRTASEPGAVTARRPTQRRCSRRRGPSRFVTFARAGSTFTRRRACSFRELATKHDVCIASANGSSHRGQISSSLVASPQPFCAASGASPRRCPARRPSRRGEALPQYCRGSGRRAPGIQASGMRHRAPRPIPRLPR
jgi:hypothetical protein